MHVPQGKPCGQAVFIHVEMRYLNEPPTKLPMPTRHIDFIIIQLISIQFESTKLEKKSLPTNCWQGLRISVLFDEIFNQLSLCKSGEIENEEIENAKSFLTTVLKQTSDSQRSLNEFYMTGILSGKVITPEEYIKKINETTKEDIVRLAQNIKLETEFYLK